MSRRPFYGWWVVVAAFAVTCFGFGCAYTFSAFVGSLQTEFSASRGSVSLVFSLAGFLYFAFGVLSGPLADRLGSRLMCVIGMVLVGLGLCAAGMAHTLTQVYLGYGLGVGLGVGCSYVPAVGAVQRWFLRRRGFASGLAVSGIGVGTLLMPPLAAHLIAEWGWRSAYVALGVLAAAVGGGMSLLLRNDPRQCGLLPDGDTPVPMSEAAVSEPAAGFSVREAVRTRRFRLLYAACVCCSFGMFVPFVHLIPYALDHGVSQSAAVRLLGAIGVGSTAGRFMLGGMADTLGRERSLILLFGAMGVAMAGWALCSGVWGLTLFALVFGVVYGGFVAVLPALAMDYFGGRQVSGILGVLYTSIAVGTLVGPSAAGFLFDATHSYVVPILIGVAGFAAAALILLGLSRSMPAAAAVAPVTR